MTYHIDIEMLTDDELKQLRCEAVELEDMTTYKRVMNEINRRYKYDD